MKTPNFANVLRIAMNEPGFALIRVNPRWWICQVGIKSAEHAKASYAIRDALIAAGLLTEDGYPVPKMKKVSA